MNTLEDLVAFHRKNPSPAEIARNHDLITDGLNDISSRLQAVEHGQLEAAHRLGEVEKRITDYETRLGGVETDRTDYARRVDTVEKTPNDNAKRIEALEKRVRTTEGAIGHATRTADDKPDGWKAFGGKPDKSAPLKNPQDAHLATPPTLANQPSHLPPEMTEPPRPNV